MDNSIIQEIYNRMLENPQFRKFLKENENKTIEEMVKEYNLDFIQL